MPSVNKKYLAIGAAGLAATALVIGLSVGLTRDRGDKRASASSANAYDAGATAGDFDRDSLKICSASTSSGKSGKSGGGKSGGKSGRRLVVPGTEEYVEGLADGKRRKLGDEPPWGRRQLGLSYSYSYSDKSGKSGGSGKSGKSGYDSVTSTDSSDMCIRPDNICSYSFTSGSSGKSGKSGGGKSGKSGAYSYSYSGKSGKSGGGKSGGGRSGAGGCGKSGKSGGGKSGGGKSGAYSYSYSGKSGKSGDHSYDSSDLEALARLIWADASQGFTFDYLGREATCDWGEEDDCVEHPTYRDGSDEAYAACEQSMAEAFRDPRLDGDVEQHLLFNSDANIPMSNCTSLLVASGDMYPDSELVEDARNDFLARDSYSGKSGKSGDYSYSYSSKASHSGKSGKSGDYSYDDDYCPSIAPSVCGSDCVCEDGDFYYLAGPDTCARSCALAEACAAGAGAPEYCGSPYDDEVFCCSDAAGDVSGCRQRARDCGDCTCEAQRFYYFVEEEGACSKSCELSAGCDADPAPAYCDSAVGDIDRCCRQNTAEGPARAACLANSETCGVPFTLAPTYIPTNTPTDIPTPPPTDIPTPPPTNIPTNPPTDFPTDPPAQNVVTFPPAEALPPTPSPTMGSTPTVSTEATGPPTKPGREVV